MAFAPDILDSCLATLDCALAGQRKIVVAVDIDEVLAHFLPQLCIFHNITYGTKLSLGDFHSYNFWEVWGGSREQATVKCYAFFDSIYFKSIRPVSGAFTALQSLKRNFAVDLVVVTSRQQDLEAATHFWLNDNFPGLFSEVRFGHHYSHETDQRASKSKAELCAELGATILIDDSLVYARQCSPTLKHGISSSQVFLFDLDNTYGWNKITNGNPVLPANVTRCVSWECVMVALKELNILQPRVDC